MVYSNIALDEMVHAQAKAAKSNKAKRRGFTLVELTISIAVIGILMAVLIPTFSMIVNSANTSSAQQSMKTSYEAILAYDLEDGYSDDYANGILVFKKSNTKVYFMQVVDGEVVDTVYKVDKVNKSVHAYDIMSFSQTTASAANTAQALTLATGSGTDKEATTYIVNSKNVLGLTFDWSDNGFEDVLNYTIVTNAEDNSFEVRPSSEQEAKAGQVGYAMIEDVTDYVAFYSIGEGSVTVTQA